MPRHLPIAALMLAVSSLVIAQEPPDAIAPLVDLIQAGRVDDLRSTLAGGAIDVNARTESGETLLVAAASYGRSDIVGLLIAAGASVDRSGRAGFTPLMAAAQYGRADTIERLVAAGANLDRADASGVTPLMIGAGAGHLDVVRALLAHGAKVNAHTVDETTALTAAVFGGHADVVQALLAANADRDVIDKAGRTLLMTAAVSGSPAVTRLLLAGPADADVEATDADGDTALVYAAVNGFLDVAQVLIDAGARKGRSETLMAAAKLGRLSMVRTLLQAGLSLNAKDDSLGLTPLVAAVDGGHEDVIDFLLSSGADPTLGGPDGATPLMTAAATGDVVTLDKLLMLKVPLDAIDAHGRTAYNYAVLNGQDQTARRLRDAESALAVSP